MATLGQLLLGALLAGMLIWYARRSDPRRELWIYAIGLVVAALIYVSFSIVGGDTRWHIIEIIGLVAFGLLALIGLKVSPWYLAAGWALHTFWDALLHIARPQPFVPDWYPVACISFDIVVAGAIAVSLYRQDRWDTRPPIPPRTKQ